MKPLKPSTILLLAGGLLGSIAFVVPFTWVLAQNGMVGIVGTGPSLLEGTTNYFQLLGRTPINFFQASIGVVTSLLEPLAALLLVASSVLARTRGRVASVLGVSGAVVALTLLLWYVTFVSSFFLTQPDRTDIGLVIQLLGVGFGLAVGSCLLGVIGAWLGWRSEPAPAARTPQHQGALFTWRRIHVTPQALLVLVGGLILTSGFFVHSFFPSREGASLFELTQHGTFYLVFWPDVLALVLMLVCGLLALTGRKEWYLGSLMGTLVGFTFVLLVLSPALPGFDGRPGSGFLVAQLGIAYAVTAIGCVLSLIGSSAGLAGSVSGS